MVESELFVAAGLTITCEQAVRFLADHLTGDEYYRISRLGHHLDRARAQLRLLDSLESMRRDLGHGVRDLARRLG